MKEYDGTAVRVVLSEADVDDTPVNGATTVPVSSNWAYDFQQTLTTAGDLPYATGAGVWARLGIGTGLYLLRTNAGATAPEWVAPQTITSAYKSSDEIVNNSTVLQNDDALVIAVGANTVWELEVYLSYIYAVAASDGIDIDWAIPAAAAMVETGTYKTSTSTTVDATVEKQVVGAGAGTVYYYLTKYLYTGGANAGNIQLQWAQNTQHASNNTVKAGSYIVAHQLT